MLQKLHWSQILKEGKVNTPNTAVFLFTYLCVLNFLDYCNIQLGPGHGEQFLVNNRDSSWAVQASIAEETCSHCAAERLGSGKQATAQLTQVWLYSQDMTKRNHILTLS